MFGSLKAMMFGDDQDIAVFERQQRRLKMRAPGLTRVPLCPGSAHLPKERQHPNVRVYGKTKTQISCKCNDCGRTWKEDLDPADDWTGWLENLALSFEKAPRMTSGKDPTEFVQIGINDVELIVSKLREIARGETQ